MADKKFPKSGLPIRKTVELLPTTFQTPANDKFMSAVVDPLVQPGLLEKLSGYIGKRYGKTYNGSDVYIDTDATLRSRYQLEPGVIYKNHSVVEGFFDYLDFKNQLRFFGNNEDKDNLITSQENYSWDPPINLDKFVNYREYFWVPSGPPTVQVRGQSASVVSTYKVSLGVGSSFIFTPDGFTNNPTLTLYRGQTYKFNVNAPKEGFVIRTNYDTGSLTYNPAVSYPAGALVVFASKLWRARVETIAGDGSSITPDSQDWEYVELVSENSALDYNKGITNNKVQNGTLTFEVPYDAPDVLFYQSIIDPNRFGRLIISDIQSNTKINVEKEIIGKQEYTSSNGIKFTNGLVVEFLGQVNPSKYSQDSWLVEGVGKEISLTRFSDLIIPVLTTEVPEILFDNEGFDTQPFDDATAYPSKKDYITISRNSIDSNPWSRYNRWFHRSVLEYSYSFRGEDFYADETSRAKRPIIEFHPNIQLFNHGAVSKEFVDYVDNYTDDIFSKIEGSTSYNIDGEFLFEGARILVVADTDSLANNKIYKVEFITHRNRKQIHLRETADAESINGEGVLVRRGTVNKGKMFHFNGTVWSASQEKTKVNQNPLFDVFDDSDISFGDTESYPVSTFVGTPILSYKVGNSVIDTELGFSISYLNIDNIGDIQFNWNWDVDNFAYSIGQTVYSKKVSTGYYRVNVANRSPAYKNGWTKTDLTYVQPILDSVVISDDATDTIELNSIDWESAGADTVINFYLNGKKLAASYERLKNQFTFNHQFVKNDVISVKIISSLGPDQGYYEIPIGLEKNPLNDDLQSFTLGQSIDHLLTSLEFDSRVDGKIPGVSNLRDLSDYQQYASRFVKHSGLTPLAISLLCDKTTNIIKSIQYSKKSYTDFKNNFLAKAMELEYNDNVADFVDDIISNLTKIKSTASPFSGSDTIGAGAYTSIDYVVDDVGVKTFALSSRFSLNELSTRAVYVYRNQSQLTHEIDYQFNETVGLVTLNITPQRGDDIQIREYVSTETNFIPPTPSSMGLYKKYTPTRFIDDTYIDPKEVIQGHDGSITVVYGDYRDDLLLELELRIYNNIKQQYDPSIFDIDYIVGGYYGNGLYSKKQLDDIVNQEFLKWVQNTNIDYISNQWFDSEDSFSFTYSNMTDPTGAQNLPGYWRGVYKWFYDTDRPHRCPWEMLGFSEKPSWWDSEYGAAPYTRNNLILWEDLRDGVIRQGSRAGQYDRYARPTILSHIPVDGDGKLLSPLDSGLAGNFVLINNKGPFVLGDIAPVEYAWRASSEWPFAVITAMCLMKPFEFITDSFDRSNTKLNAINQTVSSLTNRFLTISDIKIPEVDSGLTVGISKYLVDYIKSKGLNPQIIKDKFNKLTVAVSARLSGFVDKAQQKYLLDSKSPKASSSSIFIPPENYDIIFNISSPIASISYSGVILEKTEGGWIITGYDDVQPYFNYFSPVQNQRDPLISVGGVSEPFVDWETDKTFNNGQIARYQNDFYRSLKTHKSGSKFETLNWKKLPKLPSVGGVEAFKRRNFNELVVKKLSYGTKFTTIQQVVDFLLGYEHYLKSVGFIFTNYDPENQVSQDWLTACKEFMFWTKHNWAVGSLLTLSPSAEKIDLTTPIGVSDSLLDGFYDYQILKADGKPLYPRFINVNRSFQNITVETVDTTDGIFYIKFYYVLKEHVTVFNDRTVFNDIIYDKTTGYRQERIKTQGFRTVDWDGDYTSPGFLFDNVNIAVWQPFIDYRLGDIVAYRSYYWTSQENQLGTETFDDTKWTKLDSSPEKQLISNFDYKINQFSGYYEVAAEGLGEDQQLLAKHAIGYQPRSYLENLSENAATQFQLYQGFIREKGTANAITKVFDKLSRSIGTSIVLNEEWAFRVGQLGGIDQLTEVEIQLIKKDLTLNPQSILITDSKPESTADQVYRIVRSDFTVEPLPYTSSINPVSQDLLPIKTAGYVKTNHVNRTIKDKSTLGSLDIAEFQENDHVWITFNNGSWTVLRFNESMNLAVTDAVRTDDTVLLTLTRRHDLQVDDYVGLKITNLTGFFKIIETDVNTITVESTATSDPEIDPSSFSNVYLFTESRFSNYTDIDPSHMALLKSGSKLWIDVNEDGNWEVVEKNKQYSSKSITDFGVSTPSGTGYKVIYDDNLKQSLVSIPGAGYVIAYTEAPSQLSLKQIIAPPTGFESNVLGSFGNDMAVSPDSRWLIVGSPGATAASNYKGNFNVSASYLADDIVLYAGKLWKALADNNGDGSTIDLDTNDWEPATIISPSTTGRHPGFTGQGMISIYEYSNQQWEIRQSIISPRPENGENFGSKITVGVSSGKYYMAVSAPGSLDNRGRVYLYIYDNGEWQHLENANYKGIFDQNGETYYPEGAIVWYDGKLWQSLADSSGGSTITETSANWRRIDPVSTQTSLPTNVALDDDGSTLALGMLSETQLAELIKQDDLFGSSMAMSRDGSILAIGSPNSDGQYFENYRGVWRPDVEYIEGDVVKFEDSYHRLVDNRIDQAVDSTIRSFNEEPVGLPWENVGDSSSESSGKVYIYQRNSYGFYDLSQTINSEAMRYINDLESGETYISSGDQLGWALDLDYSGTTLVIASPKADVNFQNQGSVYVLKTDGYAPVEYRLKQRLESFEQYPNEYFGQSVVISPDTSKIIVGAKNSPYVSFTRIDATLGTSFDQGKTRFADRKGSSGSAYIFERKSDIYFLSEKLEAEFSPFESFGYSIDCSNSVILVGSPEYISPAPHLAILSYDGPKTGTVRLFKKDPSLNSLELLSVQEPIVDISKIKSIALYDNINNRKIQDVDYIDNAKLKILNIAEQELKFKTVYDPAVYSIGTDAVVVDPRTAWAEKNVGALWWNLSTAKWKYYEQGDLSYRVGHWNSLAEGASIDIYEWIESLLLPSEWAAVADTNEGLAEGISGQPLYPNNDVYTVKELYSSATGLATGTLYYYWVKNKVNPPEGIPSRRISAASVSSYISNPGGSGVAFISLLGADKFLAYNFNSVISTDTALINIQYHKNNKNLNPIHNEYQLLTEGVEDSLPPPKLENKWIDSLVGTDVAGNRVPDPALPAKQAYGVNYRPRQSMFINRIPVLKTVIENTNTILQKEPFADIIDFTNLNLADEVPSSELNLYDIEIDTYNDLANVGTARTRKAVLRANIVDGAIDTIDVLVAGFGYKKTPPVVIDGNGIGAKAEVSIDNQGRVISATVLARGRKYSSALASIRNFSVLVKSDSTLDDSWSIYSWDDERQVFYRSQSQSYDTKKYWYKTHWWKTGYSDKSKIIKEIISVYQEPTVSVSIGDRLRIKEYSNGGWAVFEKTADTGEFLDRYTMVGRELGTIQLNASLYNTELSGIGFDNDNSFDLNSYDVENSKELRNILKAVKEDIFIGNYAVEWNGLFFSSIRYVFTEQQYVDWAFKTSFLNATHNVGDLSHPTVNYKNDNLASFQDYINEVKPYRTTIREYVSRYDSLDNSNTAVADFDLPPTYSTAEGKIVTIQSNSGELSQYPWKWWADNNGYSVVAIEIADTGSDYREPPRVVIIGSGTGATAQAYISNGSVSGIRMITTGTGYTSAPTVSLVGGNGASTAIARAVAILGDSKVRTFDLAIKFDRITKDGLYTKFLQTEPTITSTGETAVFDLSYAPTRDKSKITILKNNQLVLRNEYDINLYTSSTDTYGLLKGKLIFKLPPAKDDIIDIVYEKNDELLDAVNRIQKYYAPQSGMKGNELGQLMTGIDFGGVQIQGTTFEVTGGWDALPWFTDNWDSVESSADYYVVCDGSTEEITLPFVPLAGQEITIYIRRVGEAIPRDIENLQYTQETPAPATVRIDDPNYSDNWDSTSAVNPAAQMPTFVGDGSTIVVEIGRYINTLPGDILIFRPIESDGSVTINDPNLVDTNLSGGTLSAMSGAYSTATGLSSQEISIDGDKFISPDQVPAPEENIPGQVLDSVSIKVYNNTPSGAAPVLTNIIISNGQVKNFDIGTNIIKSSSVIVYVDKQQRVLGSGPDDYAINFYTNQIEFVNAPIENSIIELISVGLGGLEILDYQEFTADGDTDLFLTNANYESTSTILVTVNGNETNVGFEDSTDVVDTPGKTLVRFGTKPIFADKIKIVCLGASTDVDSSEVAVVRINQQTIYHDGSTSSYDLDNFVNLERAAAISSMIVEVNDRALKSVDTTYVVYDGIINQFTLGTDPFEPAGAILVSNIKVFINDELKTFIQDYNYDGTTKVLSINESVLSAGDTIKIENDFRAEYSISGSNIIIADSIISTLQKNDDSTLKDKIKITWFSEYPSMNLVSDEYVGGKVQYQLAHVPLGVEYVWVYKNGIRLTQDQDYYVSLLRGVVYLTSSSTENDLIKIILFGSNTFKLPSAFEIHKDMLNIYHFKRYAKGTVKLVNALNYYDQAITVDNGDALGEPIASKNIPGVVQIDGEKIEYMVKVGNTLSQLRRGSFGTPIAESYPAGDYVVDIGTHETIPYNETQEREDFVSDGSSTIIGPLSFVPIKSTRNSWERITIPESYGPCDQIEIFVAGRRLRKNPIDLYDEDSGSSSPTADITSEAEFAVDGTTSYFRLTSAVPAGTRISVIRKTGKTWYERSETTASRGITLLENDTPIANFIAQKTTKLPE